MPLFEVNQKYLKYKSETELYRFIQDPKNRISIHIWQNKKDAAVDPGRGITRFQIGLDTHVIEWKNSRLVYGQLDAGEDVFGIKRSPIMMMTDRINQDFIKKILPVMSDNQKIPGISFLIKILEDQGFK